MKPESKDGGNMTTTLKSLVSIHMQTENLVKHHVNQIESTLREIEQISAEANLKVTQRLEEIKRHNVMLKYLIGGEINQENPIDKIDLDNKRPKQTKSNGIARFLLRTEQKGKAA